MNTNVMFTDMVGYSKLTGDDQNLALELLKEHDRIIEPLIAKYKGTIVKRIGDAIVAIFDDPSNIIQSAVEIQQSLKNRNNRNTKSKSIPSNNPRNFYTLFSAIQYNCTAHF